MHELGIVFHIIRGVEEVGRKNRVPRVSAVTLQLGEVSGVVERYLQDCWRWAADRSELLKGAQLRVETIPAQTLCESCGEIYPTVAHGKTCPACGSEHTHLLQGSEMLIKEIEVPEENDIPPEPEGEGERQCPVCGRA
ncbi:hydrogenase maturation nickel metallochaperone HypA [Allofournierella sp. CML151]|uniref:hydrogenase maturation nickel metallochaperone HypA n=1 Tax=Allofournierella sp. CML151 TaxID=2998082 RepID=UPI000B36568C|nr:hydrogenase maturation nickel metallochaperone HypA [Fournierella sp. CML151]OUN14923.1 hydrogenase nickel incorporation protein HypA [Gemmiger sp. An87]